MTEIARTLVLAIDGGGTRCRVAARAGHKIVSVETGPANVSTDLDGAIRQILRGIALLAERMDCPVDVILAAPVFVGLAGVTGPAVADSLRAALPFDLVRVADDRLAAVRGALGRRDGAIGHCGTGSFYAAQTGGEIRLSGGWGPVLGDEASAQWVGRAALRLTLEAVDGRLAASQLSERLLAEFGDASGIVRFAGSARPSEFGALAPLVTDLAGQGDAIAEQIMRQGADEIARGLRHLGWSPGQVVCLTGGIGPHYIPYLPADLRADLAEREGEPLDGAISLALDFAQDIAHERS
jgi:glucosamine kinase